MLSASHKKWGRRHPRQRYGPDYARAGKRRRPIAIAVELSRAATRRQARVQFRSEGRRFADRPRLA